MTGQILQALDVFISYSHRDEALKNELVELHLKPLQRQGKISTWQDRDIEAGTEWAKEIKENLEKAHVILLLVTRSFLASDYCYETEMQRAVQRHHEGTARVIPIILETCGWKYSPFQTLQVLPKDGKPVTRWVDRAEAFFDVEEGIRKVIDSLNAERLRREEEAAQSQEVAQSVGWASPTATQSPLPTFEFETVQVNANGQIIRRQPGKVKCFREDLGNGVSLDMVAVPGGEFWMGSPKNEGYDDEKPQHRVQVPGFYLGKYPVTQAQYRAITGQNPSHFSGDNRPVEKVSWNDAVAFCQALSQKTGHTYRLPSEAEWEYVCRAGTTTPFYFGETITTDLANYRGQDWEYEGKTYPGNYGQGPYGEFRQATTSVGSFPPNGFGLHDMHGNVWEWCQDHYHDDYEGAPTDGSAWEIEDADENVTRILRGGSWYINPRFCRSAYRYVNDPRVSNGTFGFRVVCSAPRALQ